MNYKLTLTILLLLVGSLLTRVNQGEKIIKLLTKFLTLIVVPSLLFLDCQFINIKLSLGIALTTSLIHMLLILLIAELLIRRMHLSPHRRAALLLSATLPNVVYVPYSVYAMFGLNTVYLMPYVLAANLLLPAIVARSQVILRGNIRNITLRELTPSLIILASVMLGILLSTTQLLSTLSIVKMLKHALEVLMLVSFTVLGFDISRVRRLDRDVVYPVIVRNLVSPLLMLLLLCVDPFSMLWTCTGYVKGLIIEGLTPTAVAAVLFSRIIDADSIYAATAVSVSTLISLPAMITTLYLWK